MKQVRLYDDVHEMLEAIVKDEQKNKRNLGANRQSTVNELIIARFKKIRNKD